MKRFLIAFLSLTIGTALIVVLIHIAVIFSYQKDVEAAYAVGPDQKYLFIGSSQFQSIFQGKLTEDPKYHNKIIVVHNMGFNSFLLILRELERRGQLDNIELLGVPFGEPVMLEARQSYNEIGWYQMLPVSWRYLKDAPGGFLSFIGYMATSIRYPLPFVASDNYNSDKVPRPTKSIASRPENFRRIMYDGFADGARGFDLPRKLQPNWHEEFFGDLAEMKEICDRHSIRMVMIENPLLPFFRERIPAQTVDFKKQIISEIESMGIAHVALPDILGEEDMVDFIHISNEEASLRVMLMVYKELSLKIGEMGVLKD